MCIITEIIVANCCWKLFMWRITMWSRVTFVDHISCCYYCLNCDFVVILSCNCLCWGCRKLTLTTAATKDVTTWDHSHWEWRGALLSTRTRLVQFQIEFIHIQCKYTWKTQLQRHKKYSSIIDSSIKDKLILDLWRHLWCYQIWYYKYETVCIDIPL